MARRQSSKSAPRGSISPERLAAVNDGIPLVILAMGLFYSGRLFTILQHEAELLASAARPLGVVFAQFWSRLIPHDHPPLYDLWLHVWLRLSGGAFSTLRVPSLIFFLAGIWLLSRAAGRLGGTQSANVLLWLAVFWPYGFHYGRLALWYSFSFLLIAGLTWSYLRFCAEPSSKAWYVVCAFAAMLIYVDYLGWLLLLLLAVDDCLRSRGTEHPVRRRLLGTGAFLAIVYAPIWPSLIRQIARGMHSDQSVRLLLLNGAYNVYVLLASESVAPWFWNLGVPVMLAIAVCLVLVWLGLRGELRRLLVFAGLLLLTMDLLGVLHPEQLLLVAPWVLLPIAIALTSLKNIYQQRVLAAALLIISGIGWYGTYTRRYYASAEFLEPWPVLAADAAGAIREDATVISNSPQLFLYLTYTLRDSSTDAPSRFSGFLPETVRRSNVWSIDDWVAAGRPVRPFMLWIRGSVSSSSTEYMDQGAEFLDGHCGGRVNRYLVRDPGYAWSQRLMPQQNATPWRIEIHQYDCHEQPALSNTPASPQQGR